MRPKKNTKIVFLIQKLWESYELSGFVPIEQWINQIPWTKSKNIKFHINIAKYAFRDILTKVDQI